MATTGFDSTTDDVLAGLDLTGVRVVITGASAGLGVETARALAAHGASVTGVVRDLDRARTALDETGAENVELYRADLASLESIRAFTDEFIADGHDRIDVLIANAGIMALPKLEQRFGYELQFFTNHVGHFILVTGLLGSLGERGRVVILSSSAHQTAPRDVGIEFDNLSGERDYAPWKAYGQSKLANLLFARQLATRLPAGQTANAVHPGVINTNLGRHMNKLLMIPFALMGPLALKTIPQGAAC